MGASILSGVHALSCMDFNSYLVGVTAAAIVGNIFWFFKWCAAKGAYNNLVADLGVERE